MRHKREIIIENLLITGIADKGRGVGRAPDGRVVFVEDVTKGDMVDAKVTKKKPEYYEAYPLQFHQYSEDRVQPFCEHYGVCGGCKLQHISYETQLRYKQQITEDALRRIGKVKVSEFLPIIGCESPYFYRNKLEFTFSNKRWLTKEEIEAGKSNLENVLGFHRTGAFDKIVNIEKCYFQQDPSNAIRNALRQIGIEQGSTFFDLKTKTGFLRHIMIRITSLKEILLVVSFYYEDRKRREKYLDTILAQFPEITTLHYCINPKENDYILDLEIFTYFGKGYIEEMLGDVRFRIGVRSFFQTNSKQAKQLYDVVVEFADFKGTENVYDLYTGTGSIALYVAKNCRQVVGIEEVADAIRDAEENAARNNIFNTIFYAGDVKNILTNEFGEKHGKPDLLITDPPRAGMHPKVVEMLNELAAPRLIYVSCNPATQARDLNLLSEKYDVLKVRPVDMFPHTHHIENVALLELKK